MPNQTIQYYFKQLTDALLRLYPNREAESIAYLVVEHVLNYSKFEYANHKVDLFPEEKWPKWTQIKHRLEQGEPVQYIIGETFFYDLHFIVNPAVLIPRPETEELVDLILKENPSEKLSLIDIGTGSGCIPISIKANKKDWEVCATDISVLALEVAKENASKNNVQIKFYEDDILNPTSNPDGYRDKNQKFDIIVSNPPYVPPSEIKTMHKNVADFEPHLALFSSDEDPVKFYRAIADFSAKHLINTGNVYVEIHEKYSSEVKEIFLHNGFQNVRLVSDINNKPRIVKAEK